MRLEDALPAGLLDRLQLVSELAQRVGEPLVDVSDVRGWLQTIQVDSGVTQGVLKLVHVSVEGCDVDRPAQLGSRIARDLADPLELLLVLRLRDLSRTAAAARQANGKRQDTQNENARRFTDAG